MAPAITYDPNPVEMPTGLPFCKRDTNRQLLRTAWRAARLTPTYPLEDTRAVFSLLKIMGYNANRGRLDFAIMRKYFSPPKKRGKFFQWQEHNVVDFADVLESLRAWLPMHPCHVHKLTPNELAKHTLAAAGLGALCNALEQGNLSELIDMLADPSTNEETRELIGAVLKKKTGILDYRGAETQPAPDPIAN